MADYGKSGSSKGNRKEPRNPYPQSGKADDKAELLARMKAAAEKAKAGSDEG
ncbi:hypothetical protein [Pararhodobacter oceanensis]|uniref:hypothetical protein n=1 Tax=Pararhodobacter oceanensis TaxID=2172121 RepID=UPI003A9028A8